MQTSTILIFIKSVSIIEVKLKSVSKIKISNSLDCFDNYFNNFCLQI